MKKLLSVLLALILCFSLFSGVFAAADGSAENEKPGFSTSDPGGPMRPEETEWFYRITDDGLVQARLWSHTYNRWLTDWITIGHI